MRIRVVLVAAAIAAVVPGTLVAGTASAQPVTAGTLDAVSEPGDFVGEGRTFHYASTAGTTFTATSDAYGAIRVGYAGPADAGGTLTFIPPTNQLFTAGTTYAVDPNVLEPTMRVELNFRGCGFVRGSFTVEDIAYLPDGWLDRFAASFEQHCNGAVEALRGRVVLDVAPSGPPLAVTSQLKATGTVVKKSGVATVRGTVTCSKPTYAYVRVTLTQVRRGVQTAGTTPVSVACGPTPVTWTAAVVPTTGRFVTGSAVLDTSTQATDPDTALLVVVPAARTVQLAKA